MSKLTKQIILVAIMMVLMPSYAYAYDKLPIFWDHIGDPTKQYYVISAGSDKYPIFYYSESGGGMGYTVTPAFFSNRILGYSVCNSTAANVAVLNIASCTDSVKFYTDGSIDYLGGYASSVLDSSCIAYSEDRPGFFGQYIHHIKDMDGDGRSEIYFSNPTNYPLGNGAYNVILNMPTTLETGASEARMVNVNVQNAITAAQNAATSANTAATNASNASSYASSASTNAAAANANAAAANTNATNASNNTWYSGGSSAYWSYSGYAKAIDAQNAAINSATIAQNAVNAANNAVTAGNNATSAAQNAITAANNARTSADNATTAANNATSAVGNAKTDINSNTNTSITNAKDEIITNINNIDTSLADATTNITNAINSQSRPIIESVAGHGGATCSRGGTFTVVISASDADQFRVGVDAEGGTWQSASTITVSVPAGPHTLYIQARHSSNVSKVTQKNMTVFGL